MVLYLTFESIVFKGDGDQYVLFQTNFEKVDIIVLRQILSKFGGNSIILEIKPKYAHIQNFTHQNRALCVKYKNNPLTHWERHSKPFLEGSSRIVDIDSFPFPVASV